MNENYAEPDLPEGADADVEKFCYYFGSYSCSSDEGYSLNSLEDSSTKCNEMQCQRTNRQVVTHP